MAEITIEQAMTLALQHHQAGRLQEAEQLYRQILARQQKHVQAMHYLGVIAHQAGRNDLAVDLFRQAIALNPDYTEAYSNLGLALQAMGQLDEAIAAFRQAITLNPDCAEAHSNLGNALQEKGQPDEAIAECRQAIAIKPNCTEAHLNLGVALKDKGQLDEAIAECRQAIALRPNHAEARFNLGCLYWDQRRIDDAVTAYRQAIALKPNYAEAHLNLAVSLRDKGTLDQAIATCRQAIALKPNHAEARFNLGCLYSDQRLIDDAIAAYRQAIALRLNYAEAHGNLALTLLLRGDFKRGFEENEWRWKCKDFPSPPRNFSQPQWDGSKLEARTLLLHAEQGLGDTIQFIRYLPLVSKRGGKIIIECHADLQRLFRRMPEKCQIVARGQPLPTFDLHCPLLSLPWVLGTTLDNIPQTVPYLYADAQEAGKWRHRLNDPMPTLKVGLVWAGSPANSNDRNRSMKLSKMAPLGQVPGARFFSLQKGEAADQARTPPAGLELVDWTQELKDFADNAALIANLDLVISVDTAMAHLAGAIGKPVWTLLSFVSDWRWMLDRADSPWYPTMRLFRQSVRGDWDSVIKRLADELNLWIKNCA